MILKNNFNQPIDKLQIKFAPGGSPAGIKIGRHHLPTWNIYYSESVAGTSSPVLNFGLVMMIETSFLDHS